MPRPVPVSPYNLSYSIHAPSRHLASPRTSALSLVTPLAIVNLVLTAAGCALAIYYVLMTNSSASDRFLMQTLDDKVATLTEAHGALLQQQSQLENAAILSDFAAAHGMVEAKDVSYLFEGSNVAFRR